MTRRWVVLGLSTLLALGCSGLLGYGEELATAPVSPNKPVTLTVKTKEQTAPQVWLTYEVAHGKGGYEVGGTLTFQGKGNQRWTVRLTPDGSPIVGGSGRKTLMSTQTNTSASATIHLVALPEVPAGESFKVTATLEPARGTQLQSARLIVTD